MIVTSKIRLDMAQPGTANPVYAVQGDGNTRAVVAELLANGSSWAPDDGWEAAITYRKPDGTKGLYNLLDDGSSAINISGSTATVILAQQMMTVPGAVRAAIVFNNQRLDQLTSFPFLVSVARNQFAGGTASEDYIRLQWLEDKLEEYLRKAADSGAFDGAPGADGHTPVYGVDYGTPEQIAGIANQAAEILQPEVNQIKDDIGYLGNTGETKAGAGKVLTATDDGTEWKKLDEEWELVESITFSESVTTVIKTFAHEYKKISILASAGGAEWHVFNYFVDGGTVGQVFNSQKRYRYILGETSGDTIKSVLSEYEQPYVTADVNINQNIRSGRNIKGFEWKNCKFEAGVTMKIKGVRA